MKTIMDAWWEGDRLIVVAPTFERLRVPVDAVPKLRHASPESRERFEIDEHGQYIYWPDEDVHMGWAQFQQAVDPAAKLQAQQQSQAFNQRYGTAIRTLRKERKLTQAQIPGLDARTVRRIEQGRTPATVNALTKLAAAHRMSIHDYTAALASRLDG